MSKYTTLLTVSLIFLVTVSFGQFKAQNVEQEKLELSQQLSTQSEKGFIENKGQMYSMSGEEVPFVLYKTEAPGLIIWITNKGITYQTLIIEEEREGEYSEDHEGKEMKWERVDLELEGAEILKEKILTEDLQVGEYNFFHPHCTDGIYGVSTYNKIVIQSVYKGIDWVLYRKDDGVFKYDFIVHPNANANDIKLVYRSKTPVLINENGELEMNTEYGIIKELKPISYYEGNEVHTQFKSLGSKKVKISEDWGYETKIGFTLDEMPNDRDKDLIIDPELVWGTYFGSDNNDGILSIDTDCEGNLFATGYVNGAGYPSLDIGGGAYFQAAAFSTADVAILKFNNDGVLLWATIYGGGGMEFGHYVGVDNDGNVFITGTSGSSGFPFYDPGGGAYFQTYLNYDEIFILKFTNDGIREWATFIGGNGKEEGNSLDFDLDGNLYITGTSSSTDFPTLDIGGGAYYQSAINGLSDAVILKFNNSGVLLWSSYLGGGVEEIGASISVSQDGKVFLSGHTNSEDFPLQDPGGGAYFQATPGGIAPGYSLYEQIHDIYIAGFDVNGIMAWSTYFGGDGTDLTQSISVDNLGRLYFLGVSTSDDMPTLDLGGGAYYQSVKNDSSDMFIARFQDSGIPEWGTYFGGSGSEGFIPSEFDHIAVNAFGDIYIGFTAAALSPMVTNDLPTINLETGYWDGVSEAGAYREHYAAKFDKDGILQWGSYISNTEGAYRVALAVDHNQDVFVTGEWSGLSLTDEDLYLSDISGGYYDNDNNGIEDAFFMKFEAWTTTEMEYEQSQLDDNCTCSGEARVEVNFYVGAPYTYNWSTDFSETTEETTSEIVDLCAGDYWVEITNGCFIDTLFYTIIEADCGLNITIPDDTICIGDCVDLISEVSGEEGSVSFEWLHDPTETESTVSVCPDETTAYQVIVNDDVDSDTAEVTIVVLPYPAVNLGPDTTLCPEASLLLDAENPGATFLWQDGATEQNYEVTEAGTYFVTVDNGTCQSKDTIVVSYTDLSVDLGPDQVICESSSIVLDAGNPDAAFLWNDGTTSQTYTVSSTGVYWVEVTLNFCTVVDTIEITISEPTVQFEVSDTTGCSPQDVNFMDMSLVTDGIISWLWDFGDGTSSAVQHPAHTYAENGVYEVKLTITTASGCVVEAIKTIVVEIYPYPVAAFTFDPSSPLPDEQIQFTDQSINANTWLWNFGDGNGSFEQNPMHTYANNGNYNVVLIVDNHGCIDSAYGTIIIEELLIFYVPNAFTPDSDLLNANFTPVFVSGFDPYDYHLSIFNRWGELVFESYNAAVGWNGTYGNSGLIQDGVYIWQIEFGDINNDKRYIETGHVTLLK